jgi:quaternary ammonium compound-resistance protein SugE
MAWLILVVSGVFEAVWAVALGRSEGFTRLGPSLVFAGAATVSMVGLAYAMRTLPTGTSYAVWVAIGASLAVTYGMFTGDESVSVVKIALLLGLVGCVVGLKLVTD